MKYFDTAKPRLFAHRGASGILPENTLAAFRRGLADGADLLELDVHATRDGVVVVIHDADVDRTTSGTGPVGEFSLERLRSLDAGAGFEAPGGDRPHLGRGHVIPTLKEVLEEFPGTPLNVEIKQREPDIEQLVLAVIDEAAARDRVVLAAEEHEIMCRIRQAAPDMPTSFSAAELFDFHARALRNDFRGYTPVGCALQVPHFYGDIEVVTPEFVRAAHDFELEVHVWTINDEDEMKQLIDLGIDALMSDFPSRAAALLGR